MQYPELRDLATIVAPTKFERPVQERFLKLMKPFADSVYTDRMGNAYAHIDGNPKYPHVLMTAHADNVGFMVKHIDDKGFIFTDDTPLMTCTDFRALPGTEVYVISRNLHNKLIPGVFIPQIPIHKLSDEEMTDSEPREELAIDIGAKDEAEARKYVSEADFISFVPKFKETGFPTFKLFQGTNLDDRAGMYVLYRIAKAIYGRQRGPITFASTAAEEDGSGIARMAAQNVAPDFAYTFDVTPAIDQIRSNNEDTINKKYGKTCLGKGVALARGSGIHDALFLGLERLCKKHKISYQVEVGGIGTENETIMLAGKGVPAALISIPTRYCHTPIETLAAEDLEATIKLGIAAYKNAE